MGNQGLLTKALAIAGTILIWFPILFPVMLSAILLAAEGVFRFDWLMPAEFFFVALAGWGLLLWAALRARSRRRLIGWSFGGAVALLTGGQVLAVVTGLASGEIEPTGVWWALVTGMILAYVLALVSTGIGGILLLRDLFRSSTRG